MQQVTSFRIGFRETVTNLCVHHGQINRKALGANKMLWREILYRDLRTACSARHMVTFHTDFGICCFAATDDDAGCGVGFTACSGFTHCSPINLSQQPWIPQFQLLESTDCGEMSLDGCGTLAVDWIYDVVCTAKQRVSFLTAFIGTDGLSLFTFLSRSDNIIFTGRTGDVLHRMTRAVVFRPWVCHVVGMSFYQLIQIAFIQSFVGSLPAFPAVIIMFEALQQLLARRA